MNFSGRHYPGIKMRQIPLRDQRGDRPQKKDPEGKFPVIDGEWKRKIPFGDIASDRGNKNHFIGSTRPHQGPNERPDIRLLQLPVPDMDPILPQRPTRYSQSLQKSVLFVLPNHHLSMFQPARQIRGGDPCTYGELQICRARQGKQIPDERVDRFRHQAS